MEPDFQVERLSDTIRVAVSPAHKFGTDAFLLAHFAAPRHKDAVCDLGAGCGIIPLILWRDFTPQAVTGVELQPQAVEQFARSVELSGLAGTITPVQGDLRALPGSLTPGSFDLVTCNPPYKAAGAGIPSELPQELAARHEVSCTIADVCKAASRLLRFGGRLCICNRPERLADCITAMKDAGIEPKRLRFVAKHADRAPWLFLLEGRKGGKPFMTVEPVLAVEDQNGFSPELLKIYGKDQQAR